MRLAPRWLLVLAAGGLLGGLGPAPAARALSISPNPYTVSDLGTEASIELVAVVSGVPTGGSVLSGAVDPGDTTLVFRVDMTAGSTPAVFFGIQPIASPGSWVPLAGVGWVPGGGADVSSAPIYDAGAVGFLPASFVSAGQSFDLVFLSYDAAPAQDGSLEVATGVNLVPNALATATIVPEPGSAALLAVGLALLALRTPRSSG